MSDVAIKKNAPKTISAPIIPAPPPLFPTPPTMSGVLDSLYHSGVGWFNDILEVSHRAPRSFAPEAGCVSPFDSGSFFSARPSARPAPRLRPDPRVLRSFMCPQLVYARARA
jgi:hypothetical protein